MASQMQLDFDRSKISMGFYNGMVMPQSYETVEEHLRKIKAMEIRDDDFLLCSFPKSGERERERDLKQQNEAQSTPVGCTSGGG